MTTMNKVHWTATIRAENAALREALELALDALADIPASRLVKMARFPYVGDPAVDGAMGLAYKTCAEESARMAESARSQVLSHLAERGVGL